jgi:hypothetical protein
MKRGRPKNLLARMSDETLDEICNAIIYGNRAWRFIRLRQLGLTLPPLAAELAVLRLQLQPRAAGEKTRKTFRKSRAKNIQPLSFEKLVALKVRLPKRRLDEPADDKWIEAARLWRELLLELTVALLIGDDDWLHDLAKAIRGEAQPEFGAEFTRKVLVLFQKKEVFELLQRDKDLTGVTASVIFAALERAGLVKPDPNGLKVAGRIFETKQQALDAIHDLAAKVNHELARIAVKVNHELARISKPLRHD